MSWLLRIAMRDLLPAAADLPGIEETGLDAFVTKVRAEATGAILATLVAGALIVVLAPPFTVFVPLPSFLLPRRLRDRNADRVCSRAPYFPRQAVFLLKMYACMCWGQHPSVRARLGVAPYPDDPGTFRMPAPR